MAIYREVEQWSLENVSSIAAIAILACVFGTLALMIAMDSRRGR